MKSNSASVICCHSGGDHYNVESGRYMIFSTVERVHSERYVPGTFCPSSRPAECRRHLVETMSTLRSAFILSAMSRGNFVPAPVRNRTFACSRNRLCYLSPLNMTPFPFSYCLRLKLLAIATTALVAFSSCSPAADFPRASRPANGREAAKVPSSAARPSKGKYPDPRYRRPVNFAEIQAVAGQVAKATGRKINWRVALGKDPGPLARIVVRPGESIIYLHPVAARTVPPNTWAFIFGHEFAHGVESLGTHTADNPAIEIKADIAGARYAMAAGYRVEAFLGWVLTEPNNRSQSHGSLHDRVWAIADHFGIPRNVIRAEEKRYLKNGG